MKEFLISQFTFLSLCRVGMWGFISGVSVLSFKFPVTSVLSATDLTETGFGA